jgi:cytochrome c biogenesis protein
VVPADHGVSGASTSLCIVRNAPKMLADMRSWRDNVREQSLRNFHHKADGGAAAAPAGPADGDAPEGRRLPGQGGGEGQCHWWRPSGARPTNGAIFAHGAIVIICLGGLLDSEMPIRVQQWFFGKTPFAGSGVIADIPAQHRLSLSTLLSAAIP